MRYVLGALAAIYLIVIIGPLIAVVLNVEPETFRGARRWATVAESLVLTLRTSLAATGAALVLGLPLALVLARTDFPGKGIVNMLLDVPIALPPVVMGVGLLLLWGRRGLIGHYLAQGGLSISFTTLAVVIAQFVVASPYFVRIAQGGLAAVPQEMEEVARSLGASPTKVWFTVTLPTSAHAIAAGLITCWARAIGEFGATVIFAGNFPGRTQTMPLAIFVTLQYDLPGAIAMAGLTLLFALGGFATAQILLRRYARTGEQVSVGWK